ncbi:MAG: hypothetical protein ACTSRP_06465 [Candidatus Helarchaeota archaeon]
MGFLRGFLAILFGIILIPVMAVALYIVNDAALFPFDYYSALEAAALGLDFNQLLPLIGLPINFSYPDYAGLGIPLMSAYATTAGGPGLIEALGTADLSQFVILNLWKLIVWIAAGFFVGAVMSKAKNGLLMALGLWLAWFLYNMLFVWLIFPMLGGVPMTIGTNILPFFMNAILPLCIVIIAGVIGGAVVKSEEF